MCGFGGREHAESFIAKESQPSVSALVSTCQTGWVVPVYLRPIPLVLGWCGQSEIGPLVIEWISVDVIDDFVRWWPFTGHDDPGQNVGGIILSLDPDFDAVCCAVSVLPFLASDDFRRTCENSSRGIISQVGVQTVESQVAPVLCSCYFLGSHALRSIAGVGQVLRTGDTVRSAVVIERL